MKKHLEKRKKQRTSRNDKIYGTWQTKNTKYKTDNTKNRIHTMAAYALKLPHFQEITNTTEYYCEGDGGVPVCVRFYRLQKSLSVGQGYIHRLPGA